MRYETFCEMYFLIGSPATGIYSACVSTTAGVVRNFVFKAQGKTISLNQIKKKFSRIITQLISELPSASVSKHENECYL